MRAAVARPAGGGPAPLVVVLHGSGGFRPSLVSLAESLAGEGFVALAGCWFLGSAPGSPAPADLIRCPDGPPFAGATTSSVASVKALLAAGRKLPGVRAGGVGLVGHSRGATAALLVASTGGDVQAVVAISPSGPAAPGGPDTSPLSLAQSLAAPVLLLHGTADATVPVQLTSRYEQALRALGKPVEAHYYEGAGHDLPFVAPTGADAVRRSAAFLAQHLGRGSRADTTAPTISVRVPPVYRLSTLTTTGLPVSVRCSEACSIELALTLRTSRVGSASARLAAPGTASVLVKPTTAERARLRQTTEARLTLTARVTDAAGNSLTMRKTLTIRP